MSAVPETRMLFKWHEASLWTGPNVMLLQDADRTMETAMAGLKEGRDEVEWAFEGLGLNCCTYTNV